MLAIKTENISKKYQMHKTERWALKNFNLEIEQGDCLAILGRNGSGKSTLLKILSRITPPTEGQFYIKGKLSSLLEVGVGFSPDLTGMENIFLNGTLLGMHYQDIKQELDAIIEFADIGDYINNPVKQYSSGMYMRLGFAVAAHMRNEILIIDETLSVGDAQFQQKCMQKLRELRYKEGKTILLVSHSPESIKNLCNKAIILDEGRMIAFGNPEEMSSSYYSRNIEHHSTPLEFRNNKFGDKSIVVESITFTDSNNQELQELYSGESLKITFSLKKNIKIDEKDLVIACAFGLSFNQYLAIWVSSEEEFRPREGKVVLSIPSLDLRPGVYFFSYRLGLKNLEPQNLTDSLENGFAFRVKHRDEKRLHISSCIGNGSFRNE